MKKVPKIVDFDTDLVKHNSLLSFVCFCVKKSSYKSRVWAIPILSFLVTIKLLSTKKQKELLLKWFCPHHLNEFENICFEFSQNIQLTKKGKKIKKHTEVVIISEGIKAYVQYLFPKHNVIASEIKTNKGKYIQGLKKNIHKKRKQQIISTYHAKLQIIR